MNDEIKKLKLEHENGYRKALLEIVKNNTDVLVNEDIKSLLSKPPLDSMDNIKSKFLDLAKKNKIVLNSEKLNEMILNYRKQLLNCCKKIYDLRYSELSIIVKNYDLEKTNSVIKINKKDFSDLNKKIRTILKKSLKESYDRNIDNKIIKLFDNTIADNVFNKYYLDISKFFRTTYQKQLIENFDIKLMVKDTILINITKEQGERYIYILNNSRLFNDI